MLKFKTPQSTPSWPHAVRLKAAWNELRKSPTATAEQKRIACNAYKEKMRICLREAGLLR